MPTMDDDQKLITQMRADGVVMNLQGKESGPLLMRVADRLSALKAANGELARDLRKALAARASHENAWRQEQEARLAAQAERDRMAAALREAEATFRSYAVLHASKSPPAIDKARANDILADRMLAALSGAEAMTHTPDEVLDSTPSDRLHACLVACAGIPSSRKGSGGTWTRRRHRP